MYPPAAHERFLNTFGLDGEIVKQVVSSAVASGSRAVLSGMASGSMVVLPGVASGVASGSTALRDYAQEKMKPMSPEDLYEIAETHRLVVASQQEDLALFRINEAAENARQQTKREEHTRKVNEMKEARQKEELQAELAKAKTKVSSVHGEGRRARVTKALQKLASAEPAQEGDGQKVMRAGKQLLKKGLRY